MADVGTHAMNGTALGIAVANTIPYIGPSQTVAIAAGAAAASFLVHLFVDAIPHGHAEDKMSEIGWDLIAAALCEIVILYLMIVRSGGTHPNWHLFAVANASIFGACIFDVLVTAAEELECNHGFGGACRWLNYFCHWFICRYVSGLSRFAVEYFRDKTIYGWKWGIYNYAIIIFLGVLPLFLTVRHYYF
ncbi:hypothetical protein HQ544_03775 [Candidatus Falkowbacteria bacterium]|nr:hypothetical protein [Candidatus Falkowbacteria bacterium]